MAEQTTSSGTRVVDLSSREPISDAGEALDAELREVMDPPALLARIHRLEDDVRGLSTSSRNLLNRLETIERYLQENSL